MSHEVQSRFGVSCPNSTGSFYVCEKKPIRFVGCCTVDPCKTDDGNCPDDELVTTSFDQYSYSQLQKQDCVSDSPDVEWYTCAANDPPFMGCCAVNPCAEGECPDGELFAAKLNDDDKLAALFLPDDYNKDGGGLSTGATAGIGVGAALGGIAIISVLVFFFLKRRKRNQQEAAASAQPEMNQHQHQPQSPHHTMASSPLDKQFGGSGQPSPYAATFVSTPSMQQHLSSHMSWDGAQSNASFAPSPYLPGQSPPMGQNGFPPSAYGGGGGYQHYGGYQQQQQQQPSYTELDGGDDGVHRPSELASTTIPERDDEVSRVTSPPHGEDGPGSPTYGRR